MHPEQIKAALRMRGISLVMLAEQMGVSVTTVSQVISGRSVSARIAGKIAQIIEEPDLSICRQRPSLQRRKSSVIEGTNNA